MRLPNQSGGVKHKEGTSSKLRGTIVPSVPKTVTVDECESCNCRADMTGCECLKDKDGTLKPHQKTGKLTCLEDKVENRSNILIVTQPPPSEPDFTIPGIFTNPFVAEITSEGDSTHPSPTRISRMISRHSFV